MKVSFGSVCVCVGGPQDIALRVLEIGIYFLLFGDRSPWLRCWAVSESAFSSPGTLVTKQ